MLIIRRAFGRITLDPNIANGRPTIRGLRMTVHTVLDYLAAGDKAEDILQEYPFLQPEDIQACLQFASHMMAQRYDLEK